MHGAGPQNAAIARLIHLPRIHSTSHSKALILLPPPYYPVYPPQQSPSMELYIPPPSSFMPRLPPPRPVVPAVPIVPIPDLPEVVHAPEGPYTLTKELFCHVGTPAAPLVPDPRTAPPNASFIGGAGGFIVAPPGPGQVAQAGQTAMSFGSTVVNGQTQPSWPVRMSWVNIWFPAKGEKGGPGATMAQQMQQMPGYEASISSDQSSGGPPSDNPLPTPMEVPLSALPQASTSKRMPFGKNSVPIAGALPRPKNNLRSSNSTFVTRLQAYDGLPKHMAAKTGGEVVRWGFWNLGRTFGWGEEGGKLKVSALGDTDYRAHETDASRNPSQESHSPRCRRAMLSLISRLVLTGWTL
jgi:hypothetical protein